MSTSKDEMIKVRTLRAVVGAYPVADAAGADHISKVLAYNDNGELVEKRVAYKKFTLGAACKVRAFDSDVEQDAARVARGEASKLVMLDNNQYVMQEAGEIELPESYVIDNRLVERGVVEIIDAPKPKPKKAAA